MRIYTVIINYLHKNRSHITKYIFMVLIPTVLLPSIINLYVKRYENQATLNQVILSQGLKPYRDRWLECQKYLNEQIELSEEELEYYMLESKIHDRQLVVDRYSFLSRDDMKLYFKIDSWAKESSIKLNSLQKEIRACSSQLLNDIETSAILLNVLPDYQLLWRKFDEKIRDINKKHIHELKLIVKQASLPFLFSLEELDKYNSFLLSPQEFFEGKSLKKVARANVRIRRVNLEFSWNRIHEWNNFYSEINKLLIGKYLQKLS